METAIYDGDKLAYGMSVPGPALVVLPDTTIVVPPFASLDTRKHGYFVMDVDVGVQKAATRTSKRELADAH